MKKEATPTVGYLLRLPDDLHKTLKLAAKAQGVSLHKLIVSRLVESTREGENHPVMKLGVMTIPSDGSPPTFKEL